MGYDMIMGCNSGMDILVLSMEPFLVGLCESGSGSVS
jgi:hypothetical protein